MKVATEHFVTLKTFPHYGESGVIIATGNDTIKLHMLDCKHGDVNVIVTRKDI